MSELSERMLAATSKPMFAPALLVLEDGTSFAGTSCGARGETSGELCFNTSLEGYLEVVTDPSYAGQIVTMTYPQIGNYGVSLEDVQSPHPALRGLVVRDMCYTPSSWRSDESLPAFLEREGVVAIEGIDTRALVRHLRDHGAMRAVLSTEDLDPASLLAKARASEPIVGVNLARTVSCDASYAFGPACLGSAKSFALSESKPSAHRVVAYDCGVKRSILEGLVRAGCDLEVVPWDTPAASDWEWGRIVSVANSIARLVRALIHSSTVSLAMGRLDIFASTQMVSLCSPDGRISTTLITLLISPGMIIQNTPPRTTRIKATDMIVPTPLAMPMSCFTSRVPRFSSP